MFMSKLICTGACDEVDRVEKRHCEGVYKLYRLWKGKKDKRKIGFNFLHYKLLNTRILILIKITTIQEHPKEREPKKKP